MKEPQFTSKTSNKYTDIYNLGHHFNVANALLEDYCGTAIIKWHDDIDYRSDGIHGISAIIDSVAIEIEYVYYENEEAESNDVQTKGEFTITDGFEIISELSVTGTGNLTITFVNIDFKTKTITIS